MITTCLVTVSLTLAGCSFDAGEYFYSADPPAMAVQKAEQTELTAEGARVLITLRLVNPNDRELELTEAWYAIETELGERFELVKVPEVTLPAYGTMTMALPAAFRTSGQSLKGSQVSVRTVLTFDYEGDFRRLKTESQIPLPSTAFNATTALE